MTIYITIKSKAFLFYQKSKRLDSVKVKKILS